MVRATAGNVRAPLKLEDATDRKMPLMLVANLSRQQLIGSSGGTTHLSGGLPDGHAPDAGSHAGTARVPGEDARSRQAAVPAGASRRAPEDRRRVEPAPRRPTGAAETTRPGHGLPVARRLHTHRAFDPSPAVPRAFFPRRTPHARRW